MSVWFLKEHLLTAVSIRYIDPCLPLFSCQRFALLSGAESRAESDLEQKDSETFAV